MRTRVPACVVVPRGSVLEALRASEEFPASPPAILRCRWPSASDRPRAALRAPQRVGACPSASCCTSGEAGPEGADGALGMVGTIGCGANQPSCADELAILALATSP